MQLVDTPYLSFHYIGPELGAKDVPTVIYFALSGEDTLGKDPFNQPALRLMKSGIRVLAFTLPFHEKPLAPQDGIARWAEEFAAHRDPLTPFFEGVASTIRFVQETHQLPYDKIALMGLSRGAFIGAHVMKRLPNVPYLLGFAPLTSLSLSAEFAKGNLDPKLDMDMLIPYLTNRVIRFYIGNHDTRVGTPRCFQFVNRLIEQAVSEKKREIPVELLIGISKGAKGHGTQPDTFYNGVDWLIRHLSHD